MSKLEQLINELCPEGVEYKTIQSFSQLLKGMSGVSNKWSNDGNCQFIEYKNAYDNLKIDVTILPFATVKKIDNQIELKQGDILFTSASETPDECAISSVIEDEIAEGVFMDDHLFGIRVNDKTRYNSTFLNYYFRSDSFRRIVNKTVRGVTRYYISIPNFMKLQIPIPPLPVQQEIVRILDKFTELTSELTSELIARKQQYEYYRDDLLSKNTNKKSLKQIALSSRSGGTPLKSNKDYYENGAIPWLRTQEVVFNEINKTDCFITELAVQETSAKWISANCVIVAISGASAGRCAINKIPLTTNQHCLAIEINPEVALYKYVFYCVCNQYYDLIAKKEGARGDLNSSRILGLEIPIPYPDDKEKSFAEQQRIVDILDRFDKLCNDISEGLPAEIEARQKQYEYYRDKLLTFKKKEVLRNE